MAKAHIASLRRYLGLGFGVYALGFMVIFRSTAADSGLILLGSKHIDDSKFQTRLAKKIRVVNVEICQGQPVMNVL